MKDLHLSPQVRVQPFTGLVIDVDTWATAHDYHRRHHQLHVLGLHGSGIAHGLGVQPTDPPSDTVVIEPGVAIDPAGNVIILPEEHRVTLEAGEGAVYLAVDYVESLPPRTNSNQQETSGRLVEDFRVRPLSERPEAPALELARIRRAATAKMAIARPGNPWSPGPNEIDERFRCLVYTRAPRDVSVGLVVCGAQEELEPTHLQGFSYLLKQLSECGLRTLLTEGGEKETPDVDLLYLTGNGTAAPAAGVLRGISEQLKRGSWLFADVCGPGVEFVQSLSAAVKEGGKGASQAEAQALSARFIFGAPPPGASSTKEMVWARNALISGRDYGCAWAGRRGKQVLTREDIRSALEFGVNMAVCASGRGETT